MPANQFTKRSWRGVFAPDGPTSLDGVAILVELQQVKSTEIDREVVSLALFDAGSLAVTETPNGGLLAGFSTRQQAEQTAEQLRGDYAHLIAEISFAGDPAVHWTETQRGGFTPTRVGPWHIRTPWSRRPESIEDRYDLQIDPGAAFGHGAHPSTRLALSLLTPHLSRGVSVLDLGTGTGVLALAAGRMQARVTAIDNSPVAIETARHNLALNSHGDFEDLEKQVNFQLTEGTSVAPNDDALVVANVTMDVHRTLTHALGSVRRLIVSGILCRQVYDISVAYPSHVAKVVKTEGEWAAVELAGPPVLLKDFVDERAEQVG